MDYRVTHACGHQQNHYVTGYAIQRERRLRWLESTTCRACYVEGKQAERAAAGAQAKLAVAHLALAPLIGSERQVAWANSIRASRLAAMAPAQPADIGSDHRGICFSVSEAKWWIDHRDRPDDELIAIASQASVLSEQPPRA